MPSSDTVGVTSMSMDCSLPGSISVSSADSNAQLLVSPIVFIDAFSLTFPTLAIVNWLYTGWFFDGVHVVFFSFAKKQPSHAASTLTSNDVDRLMPSATAVVWAV